MRPFAMAYRFHHVPELVSSEIVGVGNARLMRSEGRRCQVFMNAKPAAGLSRQSYVPA
jgi:hypothetical protein